MSQNQLKSEMFRKEATLLVGTLPQLRKTFVDMGLSTEPTDGNVDGLALRVLNETTGEFYNIVWVNSEGADPLGTLAHELIHLTHYILDEVRVKISVDNHETFAYLYEYLFAQGRKILNDQASGACSEQDGIQKDRTPLRDGGECKVGSGGVAQGGYLGRHFVVSSSHYPTH